MHVYTDPTRYSSFNRATNGIFCDYTFRFLAGEDLLTCVMEVSQTSHFLNPPFKNMFSFVYLSLRPQSSSPHFQRRISLSERKNHPPNPTLSPFITAFRQISFAACLLAGVAEPLKKGGITWSREGAKDITFS